jgi:MFS family permease
MTTRTKGPRIPFTPVQRKVLLALGGVVGLRMLGLFLVLPVFTLYGLQFTKSRFLVGFAFGCYGLTMAIFQIPLGRWSDRVGRRKVLLYGMTVFAIGSFICATPDLFPHSWRIALLIVGRLAQGCGAIVSTAFAAVADHIEPEKRSTAMAALGIPIGASFVVGIVGGPLLAGFFGHVFHVRPDGGGVAGLFWLTGILALVTDGLLLRYLPEVPPHAEPPAPLREVLRSGSLVAIDLGGFILNCFMSSFFFYFPLIVTVQHGLRPTQYYEILLPMLVANGIAMFGLSHSADKGKAKPLAAASFFLMAVSGFLLFRPTAAGLDPTHLLAVLIPGVLFFISFGGLEPILPSEVSKAAPKTAYGTALGAYNTMQFLGSFAGGAIGGALSRLPTVYITAALTGASLVGGLLMLLRPQMPVYTEVRAAEHAETVRDR